MLRASIHYTYRNSTVGRRTPCAPPRHNTLHNHGGAVGRPGGVAGYRGGLLITVCTVFVLGMGHDTLVSLSG